MSVVIAGDWVNSLKSNYAVDMSLMLEQIQCEFSSVERTLMPSLSEGIPLDL